MQVQQYRKKPIVVEAMLLTETNAHEICRWSGAEPVIYENESNPRGTRGLAGVEIKTLEGNMMGEFGDYIIKGVKGEFYPCRADIFAATYEEVNDAA